MVLFLEARNSPEMEGGGESCVALTEVKEREHSQSHLQRDRVGYVLASAFLSLPGRMLGTM